MPIRKRHLLRSTLTMILVASTTSVVRSTTVSPSTTQNDSPPSCKDKAAVSSTSSTSSCFVGPINGEILPNGRRRQQQPNAPIQMTPSASEHPEADAQFDVAKARLMARFSSVAYDDPPKPLSPSLPGVETRMDDFGVSVVRPISPNDDNPNPKRKTRDDESSPWQMAHVDAIEPRPLMLMLSECNLAGISDRVRKKMEESRFEWVALASNDRTSTQFDVWRIQRPSDDGGILVVAFRGTRLSSYLDLLTDIQLRQDMIDCADFGVCMPMALDGNHRWMDGIGSEETMPSTNRQTTPLMAHSGFLKAYSSIRSTLLQCLSDQRGTYDRIWFTGHSLGAALATLAVVDVGTLLAQQIPLPKAIVSAYVFGSPRVGNEALVERLARLQTPTHPHPPTVREFYRINTPGDAVVFLPRGKVVNRLGIDYVHAGASVFLPGVPSEEGTVDDIHRRIFQTNKDGEPRSDTHRIRIYRKGDAPPDPLTEIDPGYSGFFPLDPRTWVSDSFRDFLFGEAVRSFRVLTGGFAKNHRLMTYEEGLCESSQDDVFVIDNGG